MGGFRKGEGFRSMVIVPPKGMKVSSGPLKSHIATWKMKHLLTKTRASPSRVVGNLRRPPKTCHSLSESWENGDSEDVFHYAGKIRPFLKFQYLHNIRNYFFWPDLRRLPSQQTPNIRCVLVANMLESNPVVQNISEIHLRLHKLRLHKLRCIPILTRLTFPLPRPLHSSRVRLGLPYTAESQNSPLVTSGRLERPRSARVSGYIWASGDVPMGHR